MKIKKHSEVIDKWPSMEVFAQDIEVKFHTVYSWYYRGNIPCKHWSKVIETGKERGIRITAQALLDASA